MRKTNFLVRFALIIAVLVSLVFSFFIWTNTQHYEQTTDTTATTATATLTSANHQNLSQVYLPTESIYVDANKKQTLVYNYKESLVLEIGKIVESWDVSALKRSKASYAKLLTHANSLQLIYPDQFSTKLFSEVVKQPDLIKGNKDHAFTRIILSVQSEVQTVYFLDDVSKKVWETEVTPSKVAKIRALIAACDFKVPVKQEILQDQPRIIYTEPVSLKPYSYLITNRNENTYISALLTGNRNTDVDSRESGGQTTYYGGSYHNQLTVDHRNNQLQFTDNSRASVPSTLTKLLEESFTMMTNVGNPLTDIHYSNIDQTKSVVSFRNFVEGYPIFQQSEFGAVRVTFSTSGSHVNFSSTILQVPVPATSSEVTLPATETVLAQLVAVGYARSAIQDITIGYHWQVDAVNDSIVNLTPTYYLKINDQWQDYQDWLTTTPDAEAN